MGRLQKQILIGLIGVVLLTGIGVGLFLSLHTARTCSDGIQNGKEEGPDCGTLACGIACPLPVVGLQVQSNQFKKTPAGDYDLAVRVYNPNTQHGATRIPYTLNLEGSSSQTISGEFFILPGQTKYLVWPAVKSQGTLTSVGFHTGQVNWQKVNGSGFDSLFTIKRVNSGLGLPMSLAEGSVINNSPYDFDNIEVAVVVLDDSGALVAVSTTNFQTFRSQTERYFKVTWPYPVTGRLDVEINTNVFENSNFLRTQGVKSIQQ
ncbi:DUF3157 family protein [Candidatus Parcubacteria bacterium]|nr:DUF3157 family protein [Candidatus Parcubacteria bacterium]